MQPLGLSTAPMRYVSHRPSPTYPTAPALALCLHLARDWRRFLAAAPHDEERQPDEHRSAHANRHADGGARAETAAAVIKGWLRHRRRR